MLRFCFAEGLFAAVRARTGACARATRTVSSSLGSALQVAGHMEVIARILPAQKEKVQVQIRWRDREYNKLREREEPVEKFLTRLALDMNSRKKAKKDRPLTGEAAAAAAQAAQAVSAEYATGLRLLSRDGAEIGGSTSMEAAFRAAAHLEIEGQRLPVSLNPPSIKKLDIFGKPLVGCPLIASLDCEFCSAGSFTLRWLRGPSAGSNPVGELLGEGKVIWVPPEALGSTIALRADDNAMPADSPARQVTRSSIVEEVPKAWNSERLEAFGRRSDDKRSIRVVSWNMLTYFYARTQAAVKDMYPYCSPGSLDFEYRQPQIGRELLQLDGDIVWLQECSYSTYHKFVLVLFSKDFDHRCTLKASSVCEGCVLLVKRSAFEVVAWQDAIFRDVLRTNAAVRPALREVIAKWPDFLTGILPHMTTIFQICVVRHTATGEVLVVANTHLFYHPNARHIRLLQVMCLLQLLHEKREMHRSPDGSLPRVVIAGDLNCLPDTGAIRLLRTGEVASDHPDWKMADVFKWGDRDDEPAVLELEDTSAPSGIQAGDDGETIEPLPSDQLQPGMGVSLKSPLGPMTDAYADNPPAFTNFINGFNGTLDYIFTAGNLKSVQTLRGCTETELEPYGGLPNQIYPSDHLSIAADLALIDS